MRRIGVRAAALLLGACGGSSGPPDGTDDAVRDVPEAEDAPAGCSWSAARDVATVADVRLGELSGLVASRLRPGLLYVHNDSGEPEARFFALREDGSTLAEVIVDGAPHLDLEDAALETRDGREWIWLGDVGDNAARDGGTPRASVDVVRAEVPGLPDTPSAEPLHVTTHERFTFTYPDAPHDCEALIVDPVSGDLYLIAKENSGPQGVYRAAAPHVAGTGRVLERVGEILTGRGLLDAVTGADADAAGRFVVRTYRRAYLFDGPPGTPAERWGRAPRELPVIRETQGESVGFFPDGRGIFTVSEGVMETIHALDETCP
jgi:hypothetical protein